MKKIFLLVALIAVGCFVASRLLKSDDGSAEEDQSLPEMTTAEEATSADAAPSDGPFANGSSAADAVASEVAG